MFTGLIQGMGHLRSLGAYQVAVHCAPLAWVKRLAVGDSVAVDGVCLTVETLTDNGFVVTTSAETLERTILPARLDMDEQVNLEPALRVGDRLGGHFVTGHVDGMGQVAAVSMAAGSWAVEFEVPDAIAKYIVPKGSITVNGISLTVAHCTPDGTQFQVAVIPHSFTETNLQALRAGSRVNLETDILGKYVAKLLHYPVGMTPDTHSTPVTSHFLAEHGFL